MVAAVRKIDTHKEFSDALEAALQMQPEEPVFCFSASQLLAQGQHLPQGLPRQR